MVKIKAAKSKVLAKANASLEKTMRENYEQEASRALNAAVTCPVHGSMQLEVTLSPDHGAEVTGVPCCAQGEAAVAKAIKA